MGLQLILGNTGWIFSRTAILKAKQLFHQLFRQLIDQHPYLFHPTFSQSPVDAIVNGQEATSVCEGPHQNERLSGSLPIPSRIVSSTEIIEMHLDPRSANTAPVDPRQLQGGNRHEHDVDINQTPLSGKLRQGS